MSVYSMKFGKGAFDIDIPDERLLGVLKSHEKKQAATEQTAIIDALENPIESARLRDKVKPGETVCVVICDITRSWQHTAVYLPFVVDEIKRGGVKNEDIFFLVGTGTHRGHTTEEHKLLLGELYGKYKIYDHDSRNDPMTDLGKTSRGTPVKLNKRATDADHVVLTGAIIYHFMPGWGGGRKAILPGISSYETVQANHALTLEPLPGKGRNWACNSGKLEGNVIHLDMVEAAAKMNPTFMLNVIMGGDGKIGWAVAGHWKKAHEAGVKLVDSVDKVFIPELGDLVVSSAVGYPKDINLYQSTKALFNAEPAVKPGGSLVIVAACAEGYGDEEMQMMLQKYKNSDEREAELRREFTIAKYVGYCTGSAAERFDFHIVTDMKSDLLADTGIKVSKTLDEALSKIYAARGENLKTWLMPRGAYTLAEPLCCREIPKGEK
ncbi:hypothetical protein FACS1894187_00460 [Synergistales bacterium]|nr:hypothetical protein FACS1894187_00460 [Synergistales bacterium]